MPVLCHAIIRRGCVYFVVQQTGGYTNNGRYEPEVVSRYKCTVVLYLLTSKGQYFCKSRNKSQRRRGFVLSPKLEMSSVTFQCSIACARLVFLHSVGCYRIICARLVFMSRLKACCRFVKRSRKKPIFSSTSHGLCTQLPTHTDTCSKCSFCNVFQSQSISSFNYNDC